VNKNLNKTNVNSIVTQPSRSGMSIRESIASMVSGDSKMPKVVMTPPKTLVMSEKQMVGRLKRHKTSLSEAEKTVIQAEYISPEEMTEILKRLDDIG